MDWFQNRLVSIKTKNFSGKVRIVDKIMTCSSEYAKAPIINNASFEVYVGMYSNLEDLDVECPLVLFKPDEITEIL